MVHYPNTRTINQDKPRVLCSVLCQKVFRVSFARSGGIEVPRQREWTRKGREMNPRQRTLWGMAGAKNGDSLRDDIILPQIHSIKFAQVLDVIDELGN